MERKSGESQYHGCAAFLTNTITAYATGGISDSKLATGTQQLIQDLTTFLMVIAPIVTGLLIIYFCIRRSAADEMDQSVATRCC